MSYRPDDIPLPMGWTWDMVEKQRARWELDDQLVPVVCAGGAVGWGTINSVRAFRLLEEGRRDLSNTSRVEWKSRVDALLSEEVV